MPDDDYDEVEAVVRIPKGGRLADSRKTEGWSRGYTAKSSVKGPEHVEIRLTGHEGTSTSEPEPEVMDVDGSAPRREKTPEERQAELEEIALAVARVINLMHKAEPHVRRLVDQRLAPSLNAQLERWRRRKGRHGTAKEVTAPAVLTGTETLPGDESKVVGDAHHTTPIRMTADEARAHIAALLTAERFAENTRRLLANAVISDQAQPEIAGAGRGLTAEQTAKMIEAALVAQPDLLDDILENLELGDVRGGGGGGGVGGPLHIEGRDS